MGLGKTLCVISLIVNDIVERTRLEEQALSAGKADGDVHENGDREEDEIQEENGEENSPEIEQDDEADADLIASFTRKRKRKGKRMEKTEQLMMEAGVTNDTEGSTKPKSTLIVCPLSILSNWEHQIGQHVNKEWMAKKCVLPTPDPVLNSAQSPTTAIFQSMCTTAPAESKIQTS